MLPLSGCYASGLGNGTRGRHLLICPCDVMEPNLGPVAYATCRMVAPSLFSTLKDTVGVGKVTTPPDSFLRNSLGSLNAWRWGAHTLPG